MITNNFSKLFGQYISVILLLFFTSLINAQTITGLVKNIVTDKPIAEAQVKVIYNNGANIGFVNTDNKGNWSYDLSTTETAEEIIPSAFVVYQNYPNPFNPSTVINISVPAAGAVSVSIYDILGRLVDSQSEYLEPGNYQIEWQSKGSAGVYFYSIQSNNFSVTKKMIQLDGGHGKGLTPFRSGKNYDNNHRSLQKINEAVSVDISKFGYINNSFETGTNGEAFFETGLETVHNNCIMFDLHNDILERMLENPSYHLGVLNSYYDTDFPRMKLGGIDMQFFVSWVSPSNYDSSMYFQRAMDMINIFKDEAVLNPDMVEQAYTYDQAIDITSRNKIAGIIVVEGGHAIQNNLDNLYALYNAGMRYLTITWNNSTDWAVSAADSRTGTVGLSEFGKEVIRKMDSLGVIIDVSHTGIKTIEDILEVTTKPIIASHSGVRAIKNHYRNLTDDQIITIAERGGVIGLVFYPPFISSGTVTASKIADHIDYIKNLVGIDHISIGSDFDGIGSNHPADLQDVTDMPNLTLKLLERGYSEDEVRKILGGNILRVFQQVCGN